MNSPSRHWMTARSSKQLRTALTRAAPVSADMMTHSVLPALTVRSPMPRGDDREGVHLNKAVEKMTRWSRRRDATWGQVTVRDGQKVVACIGQLHEDIVLDQLLVEVPQKVKMRSAR